MLRSTWRTRAALWLVAGLTLSSLVGSAAISGLPPASPAAPPAEPLRAAPSPPASSRSPLVSESSTFDARVAASARSIAASGLPTDRYGLPYVGPAAVVRNGVVVPGPLRSTNGAATDVGPAAQGIGYYGENNTAGTLEATVVNASSLAGEVTVNQLNTLYFEDENPDVSGIQLNSILTGVTLQGTTGYDFWTQNAVDYIPHNNTISISEDTWNFSSGANGISTGTSTILAHGPNGSVVGGVYIGFGPFLPAPRPFRLTLYLNTSLTAADDQELWYNYSLAASGEPLRHGSYDWAVFNSTNTAHPATVTDAYFQANGHTLSPVFAPFDFELDLAIGPYNGVSMDVLAANMTATLAYCPLAYGVCSAAELRSVPAAEDFGAETGESGVGLAVTYQGTTAYASAGPNLLQGLWGFEGAGGTAPGATAVVNDITVSGGPDDVAANADAYVFVFLNNTAVPGGGFAWAPDVPTWHLMPGTYEYTLMLADYAATSGSLTVGSSTAALSASLTYTNASGVYTPLWAFNNSAISDLSLSGTGTLGSQFELFDNPTSACTNCGDAVNGNLSSWFLSANDYLYPTFPGLLLDGTTSYIDIDRPVSFTVDAESNGGGPLRTWFFDLPIAFYATEHVTLRDAAEIGGWPAMFGILMINAVNAAQNPFPQADVLVWDSSHDLVMSNRFVSVVPVNSAFCGSACPSINCAFTPCVSPDQLMLYGGSNNTVWGNTFADPAGSTLAAGGNASYAGLAEGESGDVVYNNNFSVDNPAMYMAYDVYNDSCWASYAGLCEPLVRPVYADTWNVTNQSASNVAEVVNGFSLSGNVLGPAYRLQGGNYWWNWGSALDPYNRLPYVNRFDYTEYRTNLPPGSSEFENSLAAGGDYVPLRLGYLGTPGHVVTFEETGLAPGTLWGATLNGTLTASNRTSLAFTIASGTYDYNLSDVLGYGLPTPSSGNLTVGTSNLTVAVVFSRSVTFTVWFNETGLPVDTGWTVAFAGRNASGAGASLTFPFVTNGSYRFNVSAVPGFLPQPPSGPVQVDGANVVVPIRFAEAYSVLFSEGGLPTGTRWAVDLNGTVANSTTGELSFTVPNGTYGFSIATSSGYAPTPASGNVSVAGTARFVVVAFVLPGLDYAVAFFEIGLPSGTSWTVDLGGDLASSSEATITFDEPNGTYAYTVAGVGSYVANPATGNVPVQGAPTGVTIRFATGSNSTGGAGVPPVLWVLIAVGGGLAAVAAVIAVRLRRNRAPPTGPSPPTG